MTSISLIGVLRIMLRFVDSNEVGGVIQKTVAELERLYELERHAVIMARAALEEPAGTIDRQAAWQVIKLSGGDAPDPADWAVANKVVSE